MLSTLAQRIITASVLAPVFIWAIFSLPTLYFSYVLLAFVALGAWEFSNLILMKRLSSKIALVFFIVLCALIAHSQTASLHTLLYLAMVWWAVNLFWVLRYPNNVRIWFGSRIIRVINGVLLLVPMWLALTHLHANADYGAHYFLLLMLLIWAADSGAYFAGRKFGKHKLAPKVSPGKSIEGVIGGIIFALMVMIIFLQTQDIVSEKYLGYLLLALVVSSVSVLGDLFESLFKRESGFKDSGQIFPGHGGVLDRIDSLTAAAPFFLMGLNFL